MVVKDVPASQSDERRDPTTTLAGWRRVVDADPASFDLLDEPAWVALPDAERVFYDEARCRYHSELVVVSTSTVRQVSHQGRLLTLLNQREISARRGLIVSGDWTTGKPPRSNSSAAPTSCASGPATPAAIGSRWST